MNFSLNHYKRKYFSFYSISKFFIKRHEKYLINKLDSLNNNFLESICNSEKIREIINTYYIIYLGVAHTSLPGFIKKLIAKGAKATLLDASSDFKDKEPNIKSINKIISDRNTKSSFYCTKPFDSSSLFEPDLNIFSKYKFTSHITLDKVTEEPVTTLSSLSEQEIFNLSPNYLCMDIQAGELLALKGASEDFFEKLYMIVTETWFKPFYHQSPVFDDYMTFFKSKGYNLLDISPVRSSHNINIYPYFDKERFLLGAQQLYSDMILIKNTPPENEDNFLKIILSLLIDYRYSDIYDLNEKYPSLIPGEVKEPLSLLFHKLNKLF